MNKRKFFKSLLSVSMGLYASKGFSFNKKGNEGLCVLTSEQMEGPFFFDSQLLRQDIRENRTGKPLMLYLKVQDANCEPLEGAVVELWHGDAMGYYSGYDGQGENEDKNFEGETFLRGYQITDEKGTCQFLTIFPGCYKGRATHFHIKVLFNQEELLTSQLYVPENVKEAIYASLPYALNPMESTLNTNDPLYDSQLEVEYRSMMALEVPDEAYADIVVTG